MVRLPHSSNHRVKGELVRTPRRFHKMHLEAGYHEQEHGEHSTPDHTLHGSYDSPRGKVTVSHIEGDPEYGQRCPCGAVGEPGDSFKQHLRDDHGLDDEQMRHFLERGPHKVLVRGSITVGPEFRIELEDGMHVTTLDAESAREYLAQLEVPGFEKYLNVPGKRGSEARR